MVFSQNYILSKAFGCAVSDSGSFIYLAA